MARVRQVWPPGEGVERVLRVWVLQQLGGGRSSRQQLLHTLGRLAQTELSNEQLILVAEIMSFTN